MGDDPSGLRVMHVCWLAGNSQGGYRTRVVEETRLLGELGHRVVLAVFSPPWEAGDGQPARFLRNDLHRQTGADVHVLPTSHFFDLVPSDASDREIIEPLARLAHEHAIQLVHGQAAYAATLALRLVRRVPGLKVVFDAHGIMPEETLMTGGHEARARGAEQLERDLLSNADLVVLVSQRMGRHFESKYGIRMRRHVLIPCCVDLAKFDGVEGYRQQSRESLGLQDSVVITYAGTLVAWQWPAAMFNAFAQIRRRIPTARLLLLVPERDHATATSLLQAAEVPPDAYILREVPNAEIGHTLVAGDVGLLLRQNDPVNLVSSPTKFGEYLAAGLPVMATDAVGDFSDWIREQQVGVIVPASDEGIAAAALDAVCAFLEDVRSRRAAWRDRCRTLATKQLSWRGRIRDLARMYHEALGLRVVPAAESGTPLPPEGEGGVTGTLASDRLGATPSAPCIAGRPLRVLFNGHDLKFARPIIEHFADSPGYEVRVDEWRGHNIFDTGQSEAMLPWADVIFCEWCLGNAKWYSQRKRPGQRLFVRLHSQEMRLPFRHELEWPNVDGIVFINFNHYDTFCAEQPDQASKAAVIFNAIDCDALDQPKLPGAEFNLGFVGINPMLKRPDLAFEILSRLRGEDSRFTLFIRTKMPWEYWWLWERSHERDFFFRFFEAIEASPHRNSVVFDAYGDDMVAWYSKVGFVLSTSDREGSHQAVAEGMAAGCVPVIRDWAGATPLYPAPFVFSAVDEAVELVLRSREPTARRRIAAEMTAYSRERFDISVIARQWEALFAGADVDILSCPDGQVLASCVDRQEAVLNAK